MTELTIQWADQEPGRSLAPASAIPVMRAGLARAPERRDLRLKLGNLLYECDRMAELVDLLEPVAKAGLASPEENFLLGAAAVALKDFGRAVAPLRAATEAELPVAYAELARALRAVGDSDEALTAATKCLALAPDNYHAFVCAAEILLARGDIERVMALCEDIGSRGERPAMVWAVRALAAAVAGDAGETRRLSDPADWVRALRPALPPTFAADLAAELQSHAALEALPSTKATKGQGRRLDDVQSLGGPLAQQLLGEVRHAIADYISAHPQMRDLGYGSGDRLQLHVWALISGPDAHETWHIHPAGQVSGVYYAATPGRPDAAAADSGAIEFGPLPLCENTGALDWPRQTIRPAPGQMLLFPSHLAHRTWPSGADEPRICVAFDALPASTAEVV